jgi:hypothetical protein
VSSFDRRLASGLEGAKVPAADRVMIDAEHTWFAPMFAPVAVPTLPAETLLVGRFQVVL